MPASKLWLPYCQMQTAPPPLTAAATDGVRIRLADGRELVDGTASWWTACHGYNAPRIRAAVERQLERMPHVMLGGLVHEPVLELADRLAALLPGDLGHSFFSESGSVSVEVAMKISIQYWRNRGQAGRRRFLSFLHGYHGDTFAAMSVCDPEEGMHALFSGVLPSQHVVPLPRREEDLAAFEQSVEALAPELAAMIVEPLVQAAGGMKFHGPDVVAAVGEVARRHGVLVIFDEIATGFGRTGSMFACEQTDVVPDIITLSKALTGGTLPLAATVVRTPIFEAFSSDDPSDALMHGPTFSGNPLACAAANASLALFADEPRLDQVARIEAQLDEQLAACRALPGVRDVRVKGAIGVVELATPPNLDVLRMRFVDAGVWVRPFGNVVYLMPALVIGEDDLARLTGAVFDVLAAT
jgi:adenosylmethionine-8-amino-7-oxononanoate aminotransferase